MYSSFETLCKSFHVSVALSFVLSRWWQGRRFPNDFQYQNTITITYLWISERSSNQDAFLRNKKWRIPHCKRQGCKQAKNENCEASSSFSLLLLVGTAAGGDAMNMQATKEEEKESCQRRYFPRACWEEVEGPWDRGSARVESWFGAASQEREGNLYLSDYNLLEANCFEGGQLHEI